MSKGNRFTQRCGLVAKAAHNPNSSGAKLPEQDGRDAAGSAFFYLAFKANKSALLAREVLAESDALRSSYTHANAAGDLLGHGRKQRGLGLRKEGHAYPCTGENLKRALQGLSDAALDALLAKLGMTLDQMEAELANFPSEPEQESPAAAPQS